MRRRDRDVSTFQAGLLALLAVLSFGSFEFVREGVRKPFVIDGFMYSTGVTVPGAGAVDPRANLGRLREAGVLSAAPWALPPGKTAADLSPLERGRAVYRAACLSCHAVDGYNAVRPLVRGWPTTTARSFLDEMHVVKPSMPPFPGTDGEKDALAAYLMSLNAECGR
jgi:mono/diheme cytochrome c family protein